MGFAAYTNWLQAPATTGQVTYTVTGFGYLPKLLILRANGLTTSNGGGFNMLLGIGAATSSSNQVAVYVRSAHNQESPVVSRGASGSNCILVRDGSNTVILQASLVSFALDGDDAKFTLDWSVTTENAHVQFDLIGGDDVEASVALFLGNSSSVDVPHGLSDAPTALMALTMGHSSTDPTFGSTNAFLAVGVSDLMTSRCVGAAAEIGSGTSMTQRSWTSDLIHFRNAAGITLLRGNVSSVDATNVTLAFPVSASRNGFLIAMRGVQAHVGETTIPAAGNLTISGCPFQPAYGMFLSPCGEGTGDDARMMIGAAGSATGSRSMSIGIAEQDNQDTTNARRFIAQNLAVNYRDHAGNIVFTGMVNSFTSDGADINMSVNPSDGLDYVLGYMFLAEAPAAPTEFTATASLTASASELSATAEVTDPVYEATAALIASASTLEGAATFTVPVYSGEAALVAAASTLVGTSGTEMPTYTATAAMMAAPTELSASVTTDVPEFQATAQLLASPSEIAGTAEAVVPVYTGQAALVSSASTLSASGVTEIPTYTGTATLIASAPTLGASALMVDTTLKQPVRWDRVKIYPAYSIQGLTIYPAGSP